MKSYKNRPCPRCGGTMFLERDIFGWCEHCLQCGYDYDLASVIDTLKTVALPGTSNSTGQGVRKLTSPKTVLELLQKHMVAQLQQD